MPRLRIDGDLLFRGISGDVAAGVASLAPFGAGNPRPVFAARGVEIVDGPRKLKERHLKMTLKQDGRIFRADRAGAPPSATTISPSTRPRSTWRSRSSRTSSTGATYLELSLSDAKSSGDATAADSRAVARVRSSSCAGRDPHES